MKMSIQQKAAIEWLKDAAVSDERRGLNLVARAGCGKTTTLVEMAKLLDGLLDPKDEVYFGAYNGAIATEIKGKLAQAKLDPRHIGAATLHSAGFSAWRRVAKDVKVDEKKTYGILDRIIMGMENKAAFERDEAKRKLFHKKIEAAKRYSGFVRKAVSLAKQRAFGFLCACDDESQWYDLVDHFGLDEEIADDAEVDMAEVIRLCIHVFKLGLDMDREVVDFDDMILSPLVHNVRMWPKRVVLLDEAQDTNPARRALAIKMLAPSNGIFVAVGDDRQAIYGFTGADSDSMDLIQAQLNSDVLPLNVTYRCPKAVVGYANKWVPDFVADKTAPEGTLRRINEEDFWKEQLDPSDAILCRNTRPLISLAYTLLRKGVACRVEGREIGQGLTSLANKWKVRTLQALAERLLAYRDREIQKLLAKGLDERAAAVDDKVGTLMALIDKLTAEGKREVKELVEFIEALFGSSDDGRAILTLSTCHKAKGREWGRVFWWAAHQLSPSKWAKKDWQIRQEHNLMYVAVTRAKSELVLVDVEIEAKPKAK